MIENKKREQKFRRQTSQLYKAFGKFAVKFELICFALRQGIFFMLYREGLKNERLVDILLNKTTADPLFQIYRSMISETQNLNNKDRQIIKNIYNRILEIIDKRNKIIHATWFIDWANPKNTDFSKAIGFKSGRDSKGAKYINFKLRARDFDNITKKADELYRLIIRLNGCLVLGHTIENNFQLNDDDNVILPINKQKKEVR